MLRSVLQVKTIQHQQIVADCCKCTRYLSIRSNKYTRYLPTRDLISTNQGNKKRWFYISPVVGFGVICCITIGHIYKRAQKFNKLNNDEEDGKGDVSTDGCYLWHQWQVDLLKRLPTRALSKAWGYTCDLYIPVVLRKPLINSYSYIFNCNLEEAVITDLNKYETFNKFFTRQLKPGTRHIDTECNVVSPADATVLNFGSVSSSKLELKQVKGLTYPLDTFVGASHPFLKGINSYCPANTILSENNNSEDCKLFYCSLYLGPGDYHWFHSPIEWCVEHRRHIAGHLFSVHPRMLTKFSEIFNFNERILLSGRWEHGLFLYGAIGAYNVGSIKLDFKAEQDLTTNSKRFKENYKDRFYGPGLILKRGETIGRFELGSSIVLVFTAPNDFEFHVSEGQKLKYGEPLGSLVNNNRHETE